MKKGFIKVVMSFVLLFSMVTVIFPPVSSAESELTVEKAQNMLIDGYNRIRMMYQPKKTKYSSPYLSFEDSIKGELNFSNESGVIKGYSKYLLDKPGNDTPPIGSAEYLKIEDERFNTIEKCYEYFNEIFTSEFFDAINTYRGPTGSSDPIEVLRTSENMKMLVDINPEIWVGMDGNSTMLLWIIANGEFGIELHEIKDLTVNGNSAVMNVVGYTVKNPIDGELEFKDATVIFCNTKDGWKISGGTFFEYLLGIKIASTYEEIESYSNPSTGSPTPIYLTLAGAALLSALPVVLGKRKIRD